MFRTRPPHRVLVAAALGVVSVAGLAVSVVTSPSAVASVPEETPVVAVAEPLVSGGLGELASVTVARVRESVVALAAASAPQPPPPVYCPAPGSEFIDSWGFARSGGRRHQGVDMMAPRGTPVVAPVAGTVRAHRSALGGISFYLVDEAGNEYAGVHLASLDVTGWVEAGTQIGTVGSTGNASSPHLHFEIHPGSGAAVDPYPFVHAWCTQDPADPWAKMPLP